MESNNQSSLLSQICLSAATSPFLVSVLVLQGMGELLQSTGKLSEEIFRAEQLPLLNFPEDTTSQ